jgi:hypothetical protein
MSGILQEKVPIELKGKIRIVHPSYYQDLEKLGSRHGRTGIEWLERFLDIKTTPQLFTRQKGLFGKPTDLSPELKFIMEKKPSLLLGTLKANWTPFLFTGGSHPDAIWASMLSASVPILNSNDMKELQQTFLPLPQLRQIAQRTGLEEGFGFLKEVDGSDDPKGFEFLQHFSVGVSEDLKFWIKLLKLARQASAVTVKTMFEIYWNIQKHCRLTDTDSISCLK